MNRKDTAIVRVCARCQYVFRGKKGSIPPCPNCGFASYSARRVFGRKCYQMEKSQSAWREYVECLVSSLMHRRLQVLAGKEDASPIQPYAVLLGTGTVPVFGPIDSVKVRENRGDFQHLELTMLNAIRWHAHDQSDLGVLLSLLSH